MPHRPHMGPHSRRAALASCRASGRPDSWAPSPRWMSLRSPPAPPSSLPLAPVRELLSRRAPPGRMACASTTRVTAPGPHPRLTPAWGRQPPPSGLPDHRRQDRPGLRAREGGQDGPDGVRPIQQASEHDEGPACVKWQPSRRRVPALEGCTPDGGRGWPVPTAHGPWSTTPWRGRGQEQPRPGAEGCGQGSWGWGWECSLATSAQPPWMSGDTRRE